MGDDLDGQLTPLKCMTACIERTIAHLRYMIRTAQQEQPRYGDIGQPMQEVRLIWSATRTNFSIDG